MDKEQQLFVIAMEESGEFVQRCSKILRGGRTKKNLQNLEDEAGDVLCMIDIMIDMGYIDKSALKERKALKREKLSKWSNIFDE